MIPNSQTAGTGSTLGAKVAAAHRSAQTIVLAIAFSIAIYLVVGLFLLGAVRPAEAEGTLQLRIPFYVAALFLSLGSIAFRRAQLRFVRLQTIAGVQGVAGVIRHLVNTTIISGAIAEAIGIISLLMAIFGGARNDVVICSLIGLMVALSTYPRRAAWEQTVNYIAQITPGSDAG